MANILEDTGISNLTPLKRVQDDPGDVRRAKVNELTSQALLSEQRHRQALEDHKASIVTGVTGAWKYETGTGVAASMASDLINYKPDAEFNVKETLIADEAVFKPRAMWELNLIEEAKSQEHYNVLKERIEGKREYMLNAQDMGLIPSMGLQLVAELGNIPNYFSFGLSGLAKANKLRRFLMAGSVVGAANVAEEAFINTMYEDRTATDYIVAGAMGMGMGWLGTVGGAKKGATNMASHMEDVGDNFGKTHMKNSVDEQKDAHNATPADQFGSVGAAELRGIDKALNENFDPKIHTSTIDLESPTIKAVYQAAIEGDIPQAKSLLHEKIGLTSMAHSMHASENPVTRFMARALFEYPEGTGRWNDSTAALEASTDFHFFSANYAPSFTRTKAAWEVLKEQNNRVQHTFDEAAYSFMETGQHVRGTTKIMKGLIESFERLYIKTNEGTYNIMKDSGVAEAAGDLDPKHLGRGWDGEKILDAKNKYGQDTVINTLKGSILDGNDFKSAHAKTEAIYIKEVAEAQKKFDEKIKKIEDDIKALKYDKGDVSPAGLRKGVKLEKFLKKLEDAKKEAPDIPKKMPDIDKMSLQMAQALYNRFLKRATTKSADANLLSTANRALLMDALNDLNLDPNDMLHIKGVLDTAGRDLKANPTKHQMGMTISFKDPTSGLRIFDMMHTDLGSAFASQHRYWLGRAAGARKGFASEEALQEAVEQLRRHGIDRGQDNKQALADIDRLEMGWKMIKGEPIEPMDQWGFAAMRVVRKLMATSALGKLGVVQAGETGRVMAASGIPNIIKGIPMIRDMIMDIKDGRLDTAMLKDIEEWAIGKIGDDHYMNHPSMRADDFGYKIKDAEKQLDRMSFWLSKASGWHLVHTQQKRTLMNALGHKWHREFLDGSMNEARFKDLGVPFDQFDSVKADMLNHAKFNKNGVLESLNLGAWEPNNRRTMAYMLHRKSSNAIQDIMTGETPLWMNRGLGKFMMQFRTFSVAALGKQTVHDWQLYKQGDREAALAFQYMLATSTMAVIARMGFDAAVLPPSERKKYLANNMNLRNIIKRVVGYHGQLSPLVDGTEMLASAVMPNTWGQLTGTSMYRNGRGLTGKIPGVSYIDKAFKGASGVAKGILPGESMSKSDWNAMVGVLPLSSWYGFHALNKGVVTPMMFD